MKRIRNGWWTCATTVALLVTVTSACSPVAPPPPTPTPSPPSTPATTANLLRMSGRVLNDDGAPVQNAIVEVDYYLPGGPSNPPSNCPAQGQFCWLAVKTNELGEYAVEFSPRLSLGRLGYVYSFRDGYEVDVQWVPVDQSPTVRDLKLHPTRKLSPGESTVVTVGPASSLCTDLEDNWFLTSRCEIIVIEAGAGTLIVEARSSTGTVVPTMYWYTSGNYSGLITRPAPGAVSIPARGGTYRVMVGLPEGSASEQFTVTTSLR